MNFTDFTRGHLLIMDNDGFPLSLAIHLVHRDGEIRFKHPQGVLLGEDQICKLQLRVVNYKQLFFRSIVLEGKIQKVKQADLYKFVVENISHEVIDTQNELISQMVSVLPEGQKPIQEFNQQLLDEILYAQNQGLLIVNTANNTHVNRILCVPNSGILQFETEIGNKLSSILQYVTEGTIIFHYKNKSLGDISLTGNIKLTKKLSKTNVYTFDPRSMIYGNQSTMESLQIRDNTIFSFKALYSKVRVKAKYWYNLLRLPLLLFSLIPVFVGSALAQPNSRNFEIKILILEILAVVFFQSAANLLNDYFDHKSDSDDYAVIYTKLNAGSRFLQLQLINVDQIKIYSIFSLLLGAAIGLYINLLIGGIDILVIGIISALIILLYNLPPVKLSYRWYGDIVFAFTIFPLILIGSSFVQLQTYDNFIEIILFGVGMAAFVTAILFVGNIMSYDAEKAALKTTFTVKFGKQHTLSAIIIFLVINYLIEVIIFASKREFSQFIPIIVSVILAIFSFKSLKGNIGDVKALERSYRMLVYAFLLNYFLLVILLFV